MVDFDVIQTLAIAVFNGMQGERRTTGALAALLGGERCVESYSAVAAVLCPGSAVVLRRNGLTEH